MLLEEQAVVLCRQRRKDSGGRDALKSPLLPLLPDRTATVLSTAPSATMSIRSPDSVSVASFQELKNRQLLLEAGLQVLSLLALLVQKYKY